MTTAIDLATFSDYKVADITLAEWGRRELDIAESEIARADDAQSAHAATSSH